MRTWLIAAAGGIIGGSIATIALACCVAAGRADQRNPTRTTNDDGADIYQGTTPNHVDDTELEHLAGRRNKGRHP